jgi:ABC-type transport system substrate-binding protein
VNKLKNILCLLLALLLIQAPVLSLAEEAEIVEPEEAEALDGADAAVPADMEFPDELIVGHPTITKGDFFTELFGNDTADIDVRALIHGYNLVNWDQNQGTYVMDPSVVTEYQVTIDELGNKTYRMLLADDLFYSDGTPITAWDYAFSILFMMSPEVEEIGGKIYRAEHLLGYDEYIATRRKIIAGEELTDDDVMSLGGVEVHGDHELWMTLDADFLPYFFETGLLMTVPYPISILAPGCKVYDEGFGVYIGNEDPNVKEELYTADLLQKTILDPETGYNTHPSVVSGPYTMISWDPATGEGHYQINPYFKGAWFHNNLPGPDYSGPVQYIQVLDEEGIAKLDASGNEIWLVKPTIEKIAFVEADNDTLIQKLVDGELHLVNKVTYGPTIREGLMGEAAREAGIRQQPYPRIGLSFLTFTYDWPTVHDKEVRQAIAWCMDRDLLTNEYCGYAVEETGSQTSFGTRVDGYFGIEQWEYLLVTGQLDYPVNFLDQVIPPVTEVVSEDDEEANDRETKRQELLKKRNLYATSQEEYDMYVAAWQALTHEWEDALVVYSVDLDKANALLDKAGFTYTADGGAYQKDSGAIRCKKMEDGSFLPLDLKMMYPEGNHMAEIMMEAGKDEIAVEGTDWSRNFIDNLARVGIKLELVPEPMTQLLQSYYRQVERTTDMIYLATNFHVIVDPSITYSTDSSLNHKIWNNTYSDDELLWNDAVNMRKTEPGDIFEYVSKWVAFQQRYNEVLPTIPIYSNIYFDFFNQYLQNYYITGQVTWSQAILPAYFALESYENVPEEETEEEGGEELESFDE